FHVPACAVTFVVEELRLACQIGHNVSWITALVGVLDFSDDFSVPTPAFRRIVQFVKPAHFLTGLLKIRFCILLPLRSQGIEPFILGDADNITNIMTLTPGQHSMAAKATITPEDNMNL